jgi:Tol biopolymer transport system component
MSYGAMRAIVGAVLLSGVVAPGVRAMQDTTRVSIGSNGVQGDGDSLRSSMTPDARFVGFSSLADDLVAGDTNSKEDVFVVDRASGLIERVSVDSFGNQAQDGGAVACPGISADGRWVAFVSDSSDLVPGDTNGASDVFIRDRATGTTSRVSVDSAGAEADSGSFNPTLTGSGQFVVFNSDANNLVTGDANQQRDVFLRDLVAGTTERVSVDSSGFEGNGSSRLGAASADGRYVVFSSAASNLVAGDTNGRDDVFVRDRVLGTTERVSVDSSGVEGDSSSSVASLSDDGRFVAFQSSARNLVAGDTNAAIDIFLRDRTLGTTTRVSVDSNGVEGNYDSLSPVLSPDGARVGFSSQSTNLTDVDRNKSLDAFVHDVASGATECVSVVASGDTADQLSVFRGFSAGGRSTVFDSRADDLDASDTNGACDVFVREPCAAPATWVNYGSGVAGTNGIPALTARRFPALGATVDVDLANSYGQPSLGLLVVGLQRGSFKTKFGADLLVTPGLLVPISFSYSGDVFTGAIPDDVAFCGATVDLQGIEFDPGAQFGVSFSQGLELVIGN